MQQSEIRKTQRSSTVTVLRRRTTKEGRSPARKINVLIADREAVFRLGLRRILGMELAFRVLGEAENEVQTIHMARQLKPDLIFLQAEVMPREAESDLPERLRSASPGCRIVVTAASLPDSEHMRYIKSGASGVILKSADPALFVKCVHKVMQGEIWLAKRQVAEIAQEIGNAPLTLPRPVDTLTPREKTIISYLVQGWRNREIAERLEISEQTVKNHLRAAYDKVGVSDRLELVLYVLHQRLELPSTVAKAVNQN
jgi:two-component system, NarL family, nitrate/nitrite response regulator NarL